MKVRLGLGAFRSFKRLSYTPWHALAEFIDNSTQSYRDNKAALVAASSGPGAPLTVEIEYSRAKGGKLRISDNAMGMSRAELGNALVVGVPPPGTLWRSRYGFGLKTAASWFGDVWTVETKRLGSTTSLTAEVDVERVADGDAEVDLERKSGLARTDHYTIVEIRKLNQLLHWRTLQKTRDNLASMYRSDLRDGSLRLVWLGDDLKWQDETKYAERPAGHTLHREFELRVGRKRIRGSAGVLARGSRTKGGFAILHAGRVIKGPPTAWRPAEIFGQPQGSNNLVSQRLVGEINLDGFPVTHTKDNILWIGDEEQAVGLALRDELADLIAAANELRPTSGRTPSANAAKRAAQALQRALGSENGKSKWLRTPPPPNRDLAARGASLVEIASERPPAFIAAMNGLVVNGYFEADLVESDSYLTFDSDDKRLAIVINVNHPFVRGLKDDGLRNHVEHCAFDAIVEWRVRHDDITLEPLTLTFLKDGLLRIASMSGSDK